MIFDCDEAHGSYLFGHVVIFNGLIAVRKHDYAHAGFCVFAHFFFDFDGHFFHDEFGRAQNERSFVAESNRGKLFLGSERHDCGCGELLGIAELVEKGDCRHVVVAGCHEHASDYIFNRMFKLDFA